MFKTTTAATTAALTFVVLLFGIGAVPAVAAPGMSVDRVAGADRYEGSVKISQQAYRNGAPVVYVGTGSNYPDALSAGAAAAHDGGPLLLTTGGSLPRNVRDEILRLKPQKIVVVGGPATVSSDVVRSLSAIQSNTVRVSGADRFETSREVVEYAFGGSGADVAYVATGAGFPDALSAGGAAGAQNAPVLLVNGKASTADAASVALLKRMGVKKVKIAGGSQSVSVGMEKHLAASFSVSRLSGADRFESSLTVNSAAFTSASRVFLATGNNFPDALAGSAWAGSAGAPLFVTPGNCVPQATLDGFARLGATRVTLLGGPASLSTQVERLQSCESVVTPEPAPVPAPEVIVAPVPKPVAPAQGAGARSGRYENVSAAVSYRGAWQVNSHSSDSGGSSSNGKVAGDYAQIAFSSTGIEWVSRTGPALGIAHVILDEVKVATVDLYSPVQQFTKVMYTNTSLSQGGHTLRVVRTGTKRAQSRGNDIVLDAFIVSDGAAPTALSGVRASVERMGVRVTWPRSADGDVVGYRLYRASVGGAYEDVSGSHLLTGTDFLDIGLTGGSAYRYAIAAFDSSGNASERSAPMTVTQPAMPAVENRYSDCPSGGKVVADIAQLRSAIAAAKPGSVIKLQSGIYRGGISIKASGTAAAPIWICGPRTAVIDNSNVNTGFGILLNKVSNVNVAGMTVQNFRKGVVLSGASHVTVADLSIRTIGEEAVKLRYGTTDSTIVGTTIRNTGRVVAMYGEGIYIGTSPKQWCAVYSCKMDRSDRNSLIANDIAGTTADPIEVKAGTTGGVVRNNIIDGTGLVKVSTLMAIKGNDYLVLDNVGINGHTTRGLFAGYSEVDGFGEGNVFARNRVSMPLGGTAVYVGQRIGNVVDCNNTAVVRGSVLTNGTCQK